MLRLGLYTLSPIPIMYQSSLVQFGVLSTQVFAKEPRDIVLVSPLRGSVF